MSLSHSQHYRQVPVSYLDQCRIQERVLRNDVVQDNVGRLKTSNTCILDELQRCTSWVSCSSLDITEITRAWTNRHILLMLWIMNLQVVAVMLTAKDSCVIQCHTQVTVRVRDTTEFSMVTERASTGDDCCGSAVGVELQVMCRHPLWVVSQTCQKMYAATWKAELVEPDIQYL